MLDPKKPATWKGRTWAMLTTLERALLKHTNPSAWEALCPQASRERRHS